MLNLDCNKSHYKYREDNSMKQKLLTLVTGLIMMMGIGGCSSASATLNDTTVSNSSNQENLSGTVNIIGSTTIQPLAESISGLLNETYPELSIEIQGVGSSAGIKAVIDSTTDIGMTSRELKAEEKAEDIDEHIVAYDGIAVIVNPSNEVTDLTSEQIKKIFEGEITNWKDVGGKDAEIIVVSREAGSGTRSAFEEMMKLTKKDGDKDVSSLNTDAIIAEGNGAIKANLASKENAIAYMSEGYLDDSVKALKIDSVECTIDNIKSGTYKISRPLLLITKGEVSKEAQTFIDCFLSDRGQEIVSKNYITVNDK